MMKIRLLFATSLIAISSPICAQNAASADSSQLDVEKSRDAIVEGFVDALHAPDAAAFVEWRNAHMQAPQDTEGSSANYAVLKQRYGSVQVMGLLMLSDDRLVVDARTENGGKVSFAFLFGADDSNRVVSVNDMFTPPPPPIEIGDDWTSLDDLVTSLQQSSGAPAIAIGIYKDGKMQSAVSGVRSLATRQPAESGDVFHWGSVGKSITGTMLGALIERGVLEWATTIGQVFDKSEVHSGYHDVPLWMLMSHQAGVPSLATFDQSFETEIEALPGDTPFEKRAEFVARLLKEAPSYQPGEGAEYSNGGVVVAGRIAEIATGLSYEELIRSEVLIPLGMNHSFPAVGSSENAVEGHLPNFAGDLEPAVMEGALWLPKIITAAGGVEGSIDDLLKFAAAHVRGLNGETNVVSPATFSGLHTLQPGQRKFQGEDYSFGWGDRCVVDLPAKYQCRSHNGGNGMFFAQILLVPDHNFAVVFAANNMEAGMRALDPAVMALFQRYLLAN